jgi:FkbM family methyltransferase
VVYLLKRLAACLPSQSQFALRRIWYASKLRLGKFTHDEPEFNMLPNWVAEGDCAIDIGANVGIFTAALSKLVGPKGHVFAFEPIPQTFQLLAANSRLFAFPNVTLMNAAASHSPGLVGMEMPNSETGLPDIYLARIVEEPTATQIFALPVDCLSIPGRVSFCKVDVEGHELSVLKGMENLLREHAPTLVVEGHSGEVRDFLGSLGYSDRRVADSPNRIFTV